MELKQQRKDARTKIRQSGIPQANPKLEQYQSQLKIHQEQSDLFKLNNSKSLSAGSLL
jgi:hypothetical protein